MSEKTNSTWTRRDLLKTGGAAAAVSALGGIVIPKVYAAEDNTIQMALVGCGGRGTGAAEDALSRKLGPTKLVAMADVFPQKLQSSLQGLKKFDQQLDVPTDRQFIGFDGYQKAMDCLKPGDVVILTTPLAFRAVMFNYAIQKGLNVFMEKPVIADGPNARRMLQLGEAAEKKNLKVGVGLMCRHCDARGELYNRIQNGEIGDVLLLRAYRVVGPTATAFTKPKTDNNMTELMYQIRNFHSFLWASGGGFSDFLIHNLDECCWMKNAWPVEAKGYGGRHYRGDYIDQNFDTYTVEYTFEDGTKLMLEGRLMTGCHDEFASYAHGSKGSAVISSNSHSPAKSRIYKTQKIGNKADLAWAFDKKEPNPYQLEWEHLLTAIRKDQKYSEVKRGVEASIVTSMGRMAAHTGQLITFDDMLKCEHEFAPNVDRFTMDGPAPLQANADGKYPVPMPGIVTKQEYA